MKKPTLFQERLAPCQEELRGLYTSLYGEDEQAYSYFLEMLKSSLAQRKSALRRLDEKHRLPVETQPRLRHCRPRTQASAKHHRQPQHHTPGHLPCRCICPNRQREIPPVGRAGHRLYPRHPERERRVARMGRRCHHLQRRCDHQRHAIPVRRRARRPALQMAESRLHQPHRSSLPQRHRRHPAMPGHTKRCKNNMGTTTRQ